MNKIIATALAIATLATTTQAQQRKDKAKFIEYKPGFYENSVLKGIDEQEQPKTEAPKKKAFKIDVSQITDAPKSADEFTSWWKNDAISQGNTGTCWSFSTTSFYETEIYRQTKQQIKLSQLFTAYWEYVEKTKRFVRERGNSLVDEGSEANAVTRVMKTYGAVPFDQFTGLNLNAKVYNHSVMIKEIQAYLAKVKETNAWNEDVIVSTVKSIMHHYMGEPPRMVKYMGKEITPQNYLKDVCKLNPDDYVDITSLMGKPYYEKVEYEVPDNWWHSADYYNVPLDDYMKIIKAAIRNGYSMTIGGDVSEAGFDSKNSNLAVVPTFDIPSEYIDENARWLRFTNGATTDDHGMHLIGYKEVNGKDWFLIKDSSSGSRNCAKDNKNFGYYFFHEDYIKLKIMDILVHKDAIKDYMTKFVK